MQYKSQLERWTVNFQTVIEIADRQPISYITKWKSELNLYVTSTVAVVVNNERLQLLSVGDTDLEVIYYLTD